MKVNFSLKPSCKKTLIFIITFKTSQSASTRVNLHNKMLQPKVNKKQEVSSLKDSCK